MKTEERKVREMARTSTDREIQIEAAGGIPGSGGDGTCMYITCTAAESQASISHFTETWEVLERILHTPHLFCPWDLAGYVLYYLMHSRFNGPAADLQDHKELCWERCKCVRNLDISRPGNSFAGLLPYPWSDQIVGAWRHVFPF